MESTATKNKEIYKNYIEDIFNQGKLGLLDLYVTEAYKLHDAPPNVDPGKKAIEQIVLMFKESFKDFKITLDHIISEGDYVSSKSTFEGTHTGNIFGIEATYRKIKINGLTMVRFKDCKICEIWVRNDMESLRRQIES